MHHRVWSLRQTVKWEVVVTLPILQMKNLGLKEGKQLAQVCTLESGREWDEVREWHGHTYTAICKIDS